MTADSASLARAELADAVLFAQEHRMRHLVVKTGELSDKRYEANTTARCYVCKDMLMRALAGIAAATGSSNVLVGANVDDLTDFRPGQVAVRRRGGRSPLVETGMTKAEVRWLSRDLGLRTWNKHAGACLSSRVAYGVPVRASNLGRVESSESAMRRMGFRDPLRVRDDGADVARLEVDLAGYASAHSHRAQVVDAITQAGFREVHIDQRGYRMGSHNERAGARHRKH